MKRTPMVRTVVVLLSCLAGAHAAASGSTEQHMMSANPIRRVVSLLQGMAKKIEVEGETSKELFDKFICACKKQRAEAAQAIAETKGNEPQIASNIKEAQEKVKLLKLELTAAKADRATAAAAMTDATSRRDQQNKEFTTEKGELEAFIGVLNKAISAIEKGTASSFIQSQDGAKALLIKAVSAAQDAPEYDKDSIVSFLSESDASQGSGEIVGILKTILSDYEKSLASTTSEEAEQVKLFDELMGAKTRQQKTCAAAIEKKTAQVGQLSVNIVNMKGEVTSAEAARLANEQFAAELESSCNSREALNDNQMKARGEELVAVHDTIKILNDDAALDLFKKALPSTSFLQLVERASQQRQAALDIVRAVPRRGMRMELGFLSLSLSGRNANIDKITKMVDGMVLIVKQQGENDAAKLEYCFQRIATAQDKQKTLTTKVADGKHEIAEQEDLVATTGDEIKAVEESIKTTDADVREALGQRKAENAAYVASMSTNSAAKELLSVAKDRMNKFYNPEAPAVLASASASFAQTSVRITEVSQHKQLSGTVTACRNVIGMLDTLIKDLDKEMLVSKLDEEGSQKDYERMMNDSTAKRTTDVKSIEEEEGRKAEAEGARVEFAEASDAERAELMATGKYTAELHSDCDWLVANADLRKESRAQQAEQLGAAKDVLSGANLSLLQGQATGKRLRGAH